MKLRKILATLIALALVGGLAITAGASQVELRLDEDKQVDGVASIVYYFTSVVADANGAIDGNVFIGMEHSNVQRSVANEGALFTEQGKDIFLDEGQASLRVDLGGTMDSVGGYVGINLWTVGSYGVDRYEFLDASGNLVATVTPAGVVTLGGTTTAVPISSPITSDMLRDADGGAKTGVGDVAVASAIALIAAGAVVFSRKKK